MDLDRNVLMVDGFPIRRVDRFLGEEVDMEGVAGAITLGVSDGHGDFWATDRIAVLIEQVLHPIARGGRYAAWFPLPKTTWEEALRWASRGVSSEETRFVRWCFQEAVDRHLRPWTRPDDRGWPEEFTPFPVLAVLGGLLASIRRRLLALQWRYKPRARTLRALLRHDHPDAFPRN